MFFKNVYLFFTLLLFVEINKVIGQRVVWDEEIDLCDFVEQPSNYRERTRCEQVNDILVEKRIYRGRQYWCIAIDNRKNEYQSVTIYFDGQRSFRDYDKYYMKFVTGTDINTEDKFTLEDNIASIVYYPTNLAKDALQQIISIKLNDRIETCDPKRTLEMDPILPNQKNYNPFRYLNNCFEFETRSTTRARSRCETLDDIIIEEFLYNNEIPFTCIVLLKNLRKNYSPKSEILELEFTNSNHKFTWTKRGITKLDGGKWNVSGDYVRIASTTVDITNPASQLISLKVDGMESCKPFQTVVDPPKSIQTFSCGEVKLTHSGFISFGFPTRKGEFPWHVALYKLEDPITKKYICGGSIISETVIISAAHCIVTDNGILDASSLRIEAAKHDLTTSDVNTREFQVQSVTTHEKYNRQYLENDIVLLRLKTYITFNEYIQPICLPSSKDFSGLIGVVPGWGRNEFNEQLNILSKATFPIVPHEDCRESNRKFYSQYLNEKNFCAGFNNGTNACIGDSGGGLVFNINDNWFLKGIVSLGVPLKNRCDITQFVLFTDVSKFNDWIQSKL